MKDVSGPEFMAYIGNDDGQSPPPARTVVCTAEVTNLILRLCLVTPEEAAAPYPPYYSTIFVTIDEAHVANLRGLVTADHNPMAKQAINMAKQAINDVLWRYGARTAVWSRHRAGRPPRIVRAPLVAPRSHRDP